MDVGHRQQRDDVIKLSHKVCRATSLLEIPHSIYGLTWRRDCSSNAITGHKHKNGSNPLSNQTIIDGDGVGDGGTGMNLSFCSNGITSRYAFNCGLSQDSKSLPQTAHSARPGLPSADEDSAT
jgi:hypothetical protein